MAQMTADVKKLLQITSLDDSQQTIEESEGAVIKDQ
jgi:hypothetical protein